MYDELVKDLREKAGAFDYDGRPDIACDYEQAADAIDALTEENERLKKAVLRYEDELGILDKLPLVDQREAEEGE